MANPIKVGINGFGRIGRVEFRQALKRSNFQFVGINELGNLEQLAHLLKYDSVHGTLDLDVHTEGQNLIVGPHRIPVSSERDPSKIPWKSWGADIVHESTGIFKDGESAGMHLKGGAKKVIISAPGKNIDGTFCMGVNSDGYDPAKHHVVSNASCTTNCLAPVVKILDEKYTIKRGTMTTIHSYTNDQKILDFPHKDLRRARAGALSMIPTTTGAAKAVGLVLPQLAGKLDGMSIRVPTPNVSVVDFTCETKDATSVENVNKALEEAAEGPLKGILSVSNSPLVSIDFNGSTFSSIVDAACTLVLEKNWIKIISWYDNETGYSSRMLDLTELMVKKGL